MVYPCVSEAAEGSHHGLGLYQSLRWEEAPGVNTFKALEGHIAKLLSHRAGQLVPPPASTQLGQVRATQSV